MANTSDATQYKGGEFIRNSSGSTRDILTVLLLPEHLYTEAEVGALVENYLQKEVSK